MAWLEIKFKGNSRTIKLDHGSINTRPDSWWNWISDQQERTQNRYRRENAVLTSDLYTSFSRCYTSGVNSFTCVGTVVVNSDFADLKGAATGNASDLDMAVTLQQLDKSIKVIKLLLY